MHRRFDRSDWKWSLIGIYSKNNAFFFHKWRDREKETTITICQKTHTTNTGKNKYSSQNIDLWTILYAICYVTLIWPGKLCFYFYFTFAAADRNLFGIWWIVGDLLFQNTSGNYFKRSMQLHSKSNFDAELLIIRFSRLSSRNLVDHMTSPKVSSRRKSFKMVRSNRLHRIKIQAHYYWSIISHRWICLLHPIKHFQSRYYNYLRSRLFSDIFSF